VQGVTAAGRNPDSLRRNGHTPTSYLVSLQTANGMVRYSRTSAQSPVWVTGEALVALSRKSLPIAPVPLKKKAKTAAAPAPNLTHAKKLAKKRTKEHGGPIATIAQTATPAPPPPRPQSPVPNPQSQDQGTDLTWILVGIGAAGIAYALYRGRRRLRTLLG
jgi:hypothetical protein